MTPNVSFSTAGIERMATMEAWHFWFIGRRRLVEQMLTTYLPDKTARLLDVGCGTGYMVHHLRGQGYHIAGIDFFLREVEQPGGVLLRGDALNPPFRPHSVDAILLLDVLEHTDDRRLLEGCRHLLRPGGWLFVSVPAFPWLWSYRDDAAGHLRRYTAPTLTEVIEQTGFTLSLLEYYQFTGLPLLMLTRWLGRGGAAMRDREDRPNTHFNRLMTWVNTTEVRCRRYVRYPWGTSLFAVARLPN